MEEVRGGGRRDGRDERDGSYLKLEHSMFRPLGWKQPKGNNEVLFL